MIHPTPHNGSSFAGLTIGLLGGSFNPAHAGHRAMSLYALKRLKLDQIWWLVSPQNPLKPTKGMVPLAKRLQQAEALARHPRLIVTALEAELGTRYTIDTLRQLTQRLPQTRFVWLMGADNLRSINQWRDWENLFAHCPIAVFRRPGYPVGRNTGKAATRFATRWLDPARAGSLAWQEPPAWLVLDNPLNRLSATQIRQHKQN